VIESIAWGNAVLPCITHVGRRKEHAEHMASIHRAMGRRCRVFQRGVRAGGVKVSLFVVVLTHHAPSAPAAAPDLVAPSSEAL
jgi:hypothetical protein